MDGIRWISMTMSERILIMVKNKVVLKERDACKLSPETASCAMFGGHALP